MILFQYVNATLLYIMMHYEHSISISLIFNLNFMELLDAKLKAGQVCFFHEKLRLNPLATQDHWEGPNFPQQYFIWNTERVTISSISTNFLDPYPAKMQLRKVKNGNRGNRGPFCLSKSRVNKTCLSIGGGADNQVCLCILRIVHFIPDLNAPSSECTEYAIIR